MLRVLHVSGEPAMALEDTELAALCAAGATLDSLARRAQVSRYRARLLLQGPGASLDGRPDRRGDVLSEQTPIAELPPPVELTLLLLHFTPATPAQRRALREASEEGREEELERLLRVPLDPELVAEDDFPAFWVTCAEGPPGLGNEIIYETYQQLRQ